jgi:hypothetical protein
MMEAGMVSMKCLPAPLLALLALPALPALLALLPPAVRAQNAIKDLPDMAARARATEAIKQAQPPAAQSAAGGAQSGVLPGPHEAPHSAQAVEQEVSGYEQDCRASYMMSSLHDCACLSAGYRSEVARTGTFNRAGANQSLLATCPAPRPSIYDWANQSCTDHVQHVRSDWQGFCACASNKFADEYLAKPLGKPREIEALRKQSYDACGLGDRSHKF